jgi:hypothetical protein
MFIKTIKLLLSFVSVSGNSIQTKISTKHVLLTNLFKVNFIVEIQVSLTETWTGIDGEREMSLSDLKS